MKRIPTTKSEREHIGIIKSMPCAACMPWWFKFPTPQPNIKNFGFVSDAQHLTDAAGRLGHEFVIPLCYSHHRGNAGFSGIKRSESDKTLKFQLEIVEGIYTIRGMEMPIQNRKIAIRR